MLLRKVCRPQKIITQKSSPRKFAAVKGGGEKMIIRKSYSSWELSPEIFILWNIYKTRKPTTPGKLVVFGKNCRQKVWSGNVCSEISTTLETSSLEKWSVRKSIVVETQLSGKSWSSQESCWSEELLSSESRHQEKFVILRGSAPSRKFTAHAGGCRKENFIILGKLLSEKLVVLGKLSSGKFYYPQDGVVKKVYHPREAVIKKFIILCKSTPRKVYHPLEVNAKKMSLSGSCCREKFIVFRKSTPKKFIIPRTISSRKFVALGKLSSGKLIVLGKLSLRKNYCPLRGVSTTKKSLPLPRSRLQKVSVQKSLPSLESRQEKFIILRNLSSGSRHHQESLSPLKLTIRKQIILGKFAKKVLFPTRLWPRKVYHPQEIHCPEKCRQQKKLPLPKISLAISILFLEGGQSRKLTPRNLLSLEPHRQEKFTTEKIYRAW